MGTKGKKIIITIGIVLLAAMLCGFSLFQKKDDEYRMIRVYKTEGSVIVDREGVGSIDAYDGMMMQSGDTVNTGKESCLYFKMDEDKFALLEPESTVRIEASGTGSDSKTVFCLESGALVSRLDSKLSPDSVYEVNTPNSTMAVRGTIFRTEVTYDENGISYTNVYVFDGTVECQLIFADGSVDEEVKQAQEGVMIRIRGDNTTSEYILDNGTVDYRQLPARVLEFLIDAIEEGIELPLSKEELEAALAEIEKGTHEHSGGTATCISPAVCSLDDCGQLYGEKNAANHTGGTEIRNKTDATCAKPGYTGDTYCLGCGELIQAGSATGKDASNHAGGTEIRDSAAATCTSAGYTGDTYCLGCGKKLRAGSATKKDASNHAGGTEIRNSVSANCSSAGYTGDTYCLGCGEMIQAGSATEKDATNHAGGTEIRDSAAATCVSAGYTGDTYCLGCGEMLQAGSATEKDATNHVGGTEIRDSAAATCASAGYTGDTYCLGCGEILQAGSTTEKDATNHAGGTEIRDSAAATCASAGYTGDTYCLGCGEMIQAGSATEKNATNHVGGTEIRNSVAADCCNAGYSGDKYCLGCGIILEEGTTIPATGDHPPAACGADGHHAHDGMIHAPAPCGIAGHCVSDGLNHDIAPCQFAGHRNCDGRTHGKECYETDSAYFTIEVVVTDNGNEWSFTFNNTLYTKNSDNQDSTQYYYYFQGYAGDTITVSRTGTTGEFYAISDAMARVDGTDSLSFTLNEGEQDCQIFVFIS